MKHLYLIVMVVSLLIVSCGKGSKSNQPAIDTTSIDTADIEQLEKELKDLEEQSSKINQKIDSVDNLLNE